MASLSQSELAYLQYDWEFWRRPEQIAPAGFSWRVWLIMAGRGWGKTLTGAEWVNEKANNNPGCVIHLIGRTSADVRNVMVGGESGILAVAPPWNRPAYFPSLGLLIWPNGSIARCFSAEKPDSLRGPQCHYLWADEVASWQYMDDAWHMANLGLRLGRYPQACLTTTPKPIEGLKKLIARHSTVLASGNLSSYANVENLPASFIQELTDEYEGTRIGQQEVYAILLDDAPGALWKRESMINRHRVGLKDRPAVPKLDKIVVGVDPPGSATGAECGIVAAARARQQERWHAYVLADRSLRGTPAVWGAAAVDCYFDLHGDIMIGEVNNGGDMVEHTIRTVPAIPEKRPGGDKVKFQQIRAQASKEGRARLVIPYYEQGRVHHVGYHGRLEDQQCQWEPDTGAPSPDRLDALVWSLWPLLIDVKSKSLYSWG